MGIFVSYRLIGKRNRKDSKQTFFLKPVRNNKKKAEITQTYKDLSGILMKTTPNKRS